MAKSIMASMIACQLHLLILFYKDGEPMPTCVTMLASELRRKIVSWVLIREIIGVSMSSAEFSKNEITQLSEVKKIDTCSTPTPSPLEANAECFSMNSMRSSFGPP